MPLVTPEEISRRRSLLGQSDVLRALAARLGRLVQPLGRSDIYLPDHKALLSRDGGVCVHDGARLEFDPQSPYHHRCPRCNTVHQGERHHRAWIWRYHLWLSERAVHLALLGALEDNDRYREIAFEILRSYADQYASYPNKDNVLGPTRLFFSTYLESIWLLQIVVAAWVLNGARESDGTRWIRVNAMVKESVELIGSFNEAWSNRQVWNNAALIAAGRWLGDHRLVTRGLDGRFGIRAQLTSRVSEEGLWYEGENYHFFALRGLLYAAALLRPIGVDLFGEGGPSGVLTEMFAAPLKTLLPDLTLPARSDSPFGVSIVQPRFAELWEVGWTFSGDERLAAILHELYGADVPDGDDAGFSELAEQERNLPPRKLRRERLGWKALLWLSTEPLPRVVSSWRRESRLLPGAGIAVLRTPPRRYISIECGRDAGGHGHPDLLHIALFWDTAFLLDFGTASYVSPSLSWYRSSLAHNVPLEVGVEQAARGGARGACVALDADRDWAWCRVVAQDLFGPDTEAIRTVVVGPSYVLDIVDIHADAQQQIELPIHPVDGFDESSLATVSPELSESASVDAAAPEFHDASTETVTVGNDRFVMHLPPRTGERLRMVWKPGPPPIDFGDGKPTPFVVRRASGPGTWVQCYAPRDGGIARVMAKKGHVTVEHRDSRRDRIKVRARSCSVTLGDGGTRRLSGTRPVRSAPRPGTHRRRRMWCPTVSSAPNIENWRDVVPTSALVRLGPRHYRRSELPHGASGPFSARVAVITWGTALWLVVDVEKASPQFRPANAPDPRLDNEMADIHSDGIQCYVHWQGWRGYVVVPEHGGGTVRISPVAGTPADCATVSGEWRPTDQGYVVILRIDLGRALRAGEAVPVNVIVNEMYADRERRAGQLALSGGGGWVYLRGDREDPFQAVLAVTQ